MTTINGMTLDDAAAFLAAEMARNPGTVPEWSCSPLALKVMLAGAFHLPVFRKVAEDALAEHQATHPGVDQSQCEQCGYYTAAVYDAQTGGRSLAADFLGDKA